MGLPSSLANAGTIDVIPLNRYFPKGTEDVYGKGKNHDKVFDEQSKNYISFYYDPGGTRLIERRFKQVAKDADDPDAYELIETKTYDPSDMRSGLLRFAHLVGDKELNNDAVTQLLAPFR
jgi:hypothetical protein